MTQTLPITQAREDLTSLVSNAQKKLSKYIITVNGSPAAALMSIEEFESWQETLDIMGDPGLMQAIKEGEEDIKKGKFITLEELKEELHV